MSYLVDIAQAVPEFSIKPADLVRFYALALNAEDNQLFTKKLNFLTNKSKINKRHSCLPDFTGKNFELYANGNFTPSVEKRMELYERKLMPLASSAIDRLLDANTIKPQEITHLIAVSCTGLLAPGFEFMIAEQYGLQHAEKSAVNFMGCYAAMKALKQAHFITEAVPAANVLIVCAELCSLHFFPPATDEDIIASLLFSDGAAAALVCGKDSRAIENKVVLSIGDIGSAYIPGTLNLMTWKIGSSAFHMFLSKQIVNAIRKNIKPVVTGFFNESEEKNDYWAIHPGGIKIVEAVKEELELSDIDVHDSVEVLHEYGNMSSPTILFIMKTILDKLRKVTAPENKKVMAIAFGPGINIEMMQFTAVNTSSPGNPTLSNSAYAIQK
jgi:alpha-pyrone synthase